jgi:hypothetical protein
MTTWMLIIFLAYSNGAADVGGSVALQSEKIDFFSAQECRAAKDEVEKAIRAEGFRRSIAVCVKRGVSLLEVAPQSGELDIPKLK